MFVQHLKHIFMGLSYKEGVRLACLTLPYHPSDLFNLFLHCFYNNYMGI